MPDETQAQPDLDALRDEKCVPLARAILTDLAAGLFPETGEMNPPALAAQSLQKLLDADANVTGEVPYVYQLILGGLTGLNAAIQSVEPAPIDDERYGRIARQLLGILATANVTLSGNPPDEAEYAPVKEQVAALLTAEKLTKIEVKYVVDNLFMAFNNAQNFVQMVTEGNMKRAEEKLFAIDDMSNLSLKKLDEVLKS